MTSHHLLNAKKNKIMNSFNFDVIFNSMRARSGGVHYQTVEELLLKVTEIPRPTSLTNPTTLNSPLSSIEELLRQQLCSKCEKMNPQGYFFTQKDQIQAQEEKQLQRGSRDDSGGINQMIEVALICQQMTQIKTILTQTTSKQVQLIPKSQQNQSKDDRLILQANGIEVEEDVKFSYYKKEKIDVLLQGQESSEEDTVVDKKDDEMKNKLTNGSYYPLDLVIQYNKVSNKIFSDSQQQDHSWQCLRIWLIDWQQPHKNILRVYLTKCQKVFRVKLSQGKIYIKRTTIDRLEPFQSIHEKQSQFRQNQLQKIQEHIRTN